MKGQSFSSNFAASVFAVGARYMGATYRRFLIQRPNARCGVFPTRGRRRSWVELSASPCALRTQDRRTLRRPLGICLEKGACTYILFVRPPGIRSHSKGETMIIGDRLRELREGKKLSQGDIEKRTGLLRCYISRVENGHTVPAIETLEKLARALEIPLYQLFYEGEQPPKLPNLLKRKTSDDIAWGSSGKQAVFLHKLRKCLSKAGDADRKLLLAMAQKLSAGRGRRAQAAA
jgi:transcriptional regulator with XRE-family HTH domain